MPCLELFLLTARHGLGMAVSKDRSQSPPATWHLRLSRRHGPECAREGMAKDSALPSRARSRRVDPGVGPWERASTPEPQVSVYKVGVVTGLLGGVDESVPGKCKEKTRLVQNISSINAATHCHQILKRRTEARPLLTSKGLHQHTQHSLPQKALR